MIESHYQCGKACINPKINTVSLKMNSSLKNVEIVTFNLGPIENNTYLISDPSSHDAVVIDPSFDIHSVLEQITDLKLRVKNILLTHAHFDHIAGVNELHKALLDDPNVGLHSLDLALWRERGKALDYGFQLEPVPDPDHFLDDGESLSVGGFHIDVLHTPGHSPGHVVFSIPDIQAIVCGDVIFAGSIGRTDLPGGNHFQLLNSIRTKILCFPDETRLLPGHGPETTVGVERLNNPFLK
jgi:hydroxyacylglutathione hydrolase